MNIEHQKYVDKAIDEILHPTFTLTKQYLEVHEVKFEDGLPKVERVDANFYENKVSVFFPIKGYGFFLEIHLTHGPEIKVDFVYIQSGHRIYLTATSEELTFDELSQLLNFRPISGWSKGDIRTRAKRVAKFSRISFEPIVNQAYEFKHKLDLLLTELEKDVENVNRLTELSSVSISVLRHQYVSGNAGFHFDLELINRLSKLNLSLDIDTYITGNELLYVDQE